MKKYGVIIATFTIMIGVMAICFNMAFGNNTITYLTKIRVQYGTNIGFYYWKFDFQNYLTQINLYTTDLSILQFELPTREWQTIQGNIFQDIWWQYLGNDLAVILNYIIMGINIILYPLKVGSYLLRNILVILGINQNTNQQGNGLAWLVVFVRDILGQIVIPYV